MGKMNKLGKRCNLKKNSYHTDMKIILFALFFSFSIPAHSLAEEALLALSKWQIQGPAKVRLVAGIMPVGQPSIGIEVRLEPGWRTYWKYPGASGIAPRFDWSGSLNFEPHAPRFETPMRFRDVTGDYFGYEIGTVFSVPISVRQAKPRLSFEADISPDTLEPDILGDNKEQILQLNLALDIGVCQTICLPLRFTFSGLLDPSVFLNDNRLAIFARHLKSLPAAATEKLRIDRLTYDGVSLNMVVLGEALLEPEIIIAGDALDVFDELVYLGKDETAYLVTIPAWTGLDVPFIGRALEVVLVNGAYAVTQKIIVQAP